jgi:hypothetical protein
MGTPTIAIRVNFSANRKYSTAFGFSETMKYTGFIFLFHPLFSWTAAYARAARATLTFEYDISILKTGKDLLDGSLFVLIEYIIEDTCGKACFKGTGNLDPKLGSAPVDFICSSPQAKRAVAILRAFIGEELDHDGAFSRTVPTVYRIAV